MKGVIVDCLKEMIVKKFNQTAWVEILQKANLTGNLTVYSDIEDSVVMNLVRTTCRHLNLSLTQAADAFGDYWVNDYATKKFKHFYITNRTAKDFILNIDKMHVTLTNTIKDAAPPRFDYQWKNETTLLITYKSKRTMLDFAVGLLKGVGKYYHEDIQVFKTGVNKIQVNF